MHRTEVKTDENALKGQIKKSIADLKKESQEIQAEIVDLKTKRKNLSNYLLNAVREEKMKLEDVIIKSESLTKELKESKDKYDFQLKELADERFQFKVYVEGQDAEHAKERDRIHREKQKIKDKEQVLKDSSAKVAMREKDVIEEEKSVSGREVMIESAAKKLDAQVKVFNVKKGEIDDFMLAFVEGKEIIEKARKEIEEKETNMLKYADALKKKENELLEEKKEIDRQRGIVQAREGEIKEKLDDAVIVGKQNQAEVIRLKAQAKDLDNRESKIEEREKLFKQNIGG